MGDDYKLYFLEDQENNPVAVVLPKDATQDLTPALPEVSNAAFLPFDIKKLVALLCCWMLACCTWSD